MTSISITYIRRKTPSGGGFLSDWGAEEELSIGANEAIPFVLIYDVNIKQSNTRCVDI